MKRFAMIMAGLSLALAGADAAKAADMYEVVTIAPATTNINLGLFRINVATGQVVAAFGYVPNYTVLAEPTKLPAGEYHLRVTETLDRTGGWYLNRYDAISGRLWYASGGGNAPFVWFEIAEPPPAPAAPK
jgi:hypothetical protein